MDQTKVKNKRVKVNGSLFSGDPTLNKLMHTMDLADGGKKKFGSWTSISFTTKSKLTSAYKKRLCNHLLQPENVFFVQIEEYFAIKPDILMLSNGKNWVWYNDMKEKLENAGYKETKYKNLNDNALKYAFKDLYVSL